MGKSVKGSLTRPKLLKSFACESLTNYRYACFARVANEGGCDRIATHFAEPVMNEMMHASFFFSYTDSSKAPINCQACNQSGAPAFKSKQKITDAPNRIKPNYNTNQQQNVLI